MKMALKDNQILIKEADNNQYMIIKSWQKMKWSKAQQMLYGPADAELLNKLAGLVALPPVIEEYRKKLNIIAEAVDRERLKDDPKPMYKFPVKKKLYKHQIRGVNMALMVFGLLEPPIIKKEEDDIC